MIEIKTQEQLDAAILENGLVDLWAPWCGPCKILKPKLENLSSEYSNIYSINVNDFPELGSSLNVRNIPTVIKFNEGKETHRIVGDKPIEEYKEIL